MKLSDNIRRIRRKRDITQAELGEALNVRQTTIANWEAGRSEPSAENIAVIAKVLDCSISELFGERAVETVNVDGLDEKDIAAVNAVILRLKSRGGGHNKQLAIIILSVIILSSLVYRTPARQTTPKPNKIKRCIYAPHYILKTVPYNAPDKPPKIHRKIT